MSNDDVPNRESPPLSEIPTPWGPIRAPLRSIGYFALGLFLAYLIMLFVVIPRRVPVLADPMIEAALTAQPAPTVVPSLVVRNPSGGGGSVRYYCVVRGQDRPVTVRIEPIPAGVSEAEYSWEVAGATLTKAFDWERDLEIGEDKEIGDLITVNVCRGNVCLRPVTFQVQEVCPQ
jgi:hypothetical protein